MKTLATITALFLLAVTAQAKVLIYKGNIRVVTDAITVLPKTVGIFQIVDPDQSTIASVITLVLDGKKLVISGSPSTFQFAQAPLRDGRTATIVSLASVNGLSNDNFENIAIHFRGTNTTLKFSSQLAANVITYPRSFLGIAIDDEASNGVGAFIEQKVALSYQEGRTVAANDANQTTQKVADALVAELQAKGFQLP